MKLPQTFTAIATLILLSPSVIAEEVYQPLDTRTRCIVLLRECLVLIENKDVNGIFKKIADGGVKNFKLTNSPESFPPKMKQEIQDVDRFFKRNFRAAPVLQKAFNDLQYSELVTAKELVPVSIATDKKAEAKLHTIKIKIRIPDEDRPEFGELRFLEIGDNLYWVPFGW
ncbi:hypothetical protein N9D23_11675 [Rubripirellula sp.]|nr:hypothetical protein [Rubripirellula sp.]